MKLRTVIIDDNEVDLDLANSFARKIDFLDIVSTFPSALEALSPLRAGDVDLLICDV
jgi:two-component system, LytTR family, response regulator